MPRLSLAAVVCVFCVASPALGQDDPAAARLAKEKALRLERQQRVEKERAAEKEAAKPAGTELGSPLTDEEAAVLEKKVVTAPEGIAMPELFTQLHPSRFVYLRRRLTEFDLARPYEWFGFSLPDRMPGEGEAVVLVKDVDDRKSNYKLEGWLRYLVVWTLTGDAIQVRPEWLSATPLPKKRKAPITAADLNVADADGKYLGGPPDFVVVDTGWALEHEPAWLSLLPAGDARFEQFRAQQAKIISCYQKKRAEYDPDGNLAKYYDVATYGPGGVSKIESAATNFDRKACGACGCKAFNQKRAALAKQVLGAAQKADFEKLYAPVVKRLDSLK